MRDLSRLVKYSAVLRKKPPVAWALARNYLLQKACGRRVLCTVDLAVTYRCQAQCRRCSCKPLKEDGRRESTPDEVSRILARTRGLGAFLVNFTGGEPCLRDDLPELVSRASALRMLVSITSNCAFLGNGALEGLARRGLDVLQVSLDSPCPGEHDSSRGIAGNHGQVMAAVREARELGLVVLINTVVTHDALSRGRVKELLEVADSHGCFLSLILPVHINKDTPASEYALTPEDLDLVRRMRTLPSVTSDIESSLHGGQCPAGNGKMYVSPYADVYPCPFIHRQCGNLLKEDVAEVWGRMAGEGRSGCVGGKPAS